MKKKATCAPIAIIALVFLSTCLNSTPTYASFSKALYNRSKSVASRTNTIWVPDNYTTIQEAINNATEEETIFVRSGTYYERVVVNKKVSLIGENKQDTIIDGNGTEIAVRVTAHNVNIAGFTIQNGELGILFWYSHNNNLTSSVIANNQYGIYTWGSAKNTFAGNTVINNSRYGIYVSDSDDNVLSGNTVSNNSYGIYLDDSCRNTLASNTVSSNNDDGILLSHSNDNVLSGNKASDNKYGIYVSDSDGNVLSGNTVSRNAYGIYLYYCRDSILASNGVSNNSNGLYFLGSNDNILVENRISSSLYDGIWVYSSSNNIFIRNIISHNSIGIGVQMSSNNNMIFHNNFVNNIESPRSVDSINSWDNGVEGNYWRDYDGTDENHDGIGDTPYLIEENSQDEYPLMAIFLQFNIPTENMDYKINTVCNSTISNFQLHSDSDDKPNAVSFKVNGAGFCRISIPHALVEPPFMVRVDGNPSLYFKEVYANATHTWLYFNYSHSEHEVTIMHTSPSEQLLWPQLTIFGLAIIIVILFSIGVNYYHLFSKQKKVIEAYEREFGSFPVSHEERARMRFIKDVIEREKKIEEFKKKYGIKIQPASTLEDLMEKLGVQKES